MANRKDQRLQAWMESPQFVGRAVAGLAQDPQRMEKTGLVLQTRALAAEYGFEDIGGHRPK